MLQAVRQSSEKVYLGLTGKSSTSLLIKDQMGKALQDVLDKASVQDNMVTDARKMLWLPGWPTQPSELVWRPAWPRAGDALATEAAAEGGMRDEIF